MDQPNDFEMYQARMLIRESRLAYFEAMASHHSRVAQLACDMRKFIEAFRISGTEEDEKFLEYMATHIERSFATAFGFELFTMAHKPHCVYCSIHQELADEATESKGDE